MEVRRQGMVRQSFSHGRTKAVVVEKVKRRMVAPGEAKANRPPALRRPRLPCDPASLALADLGVGQCMRRGRCAPRSVRTKTDLVVMSSGGRIFAFFLL